MHQTCGRKPIIIIHICHIIIHICHIIIHISVRVCVFQTCGRKPIRRRPWTMPTYVTSSYTYVTSSNLRQEAHQTKTLDHATRVRRLSVHLCVYTYSDSDNVIIHICHIIIHICHIIIHICHIIIHISHHHTHMSHHHPHICACIRIKTTPPIPRACVASACACASMRATPQRVRVPLCVLRLSVCVCLYACYASACACASMRATPQRVRVSLCVLRLSVRVCLYACYASPCACVSMRASPLDLGLAEYVHCITFMYMDRRNTPRGGRFPKPAFVEFGSAE
jgi:hypothetical protein